jgi:hypothetical protein
MTLPDPLNDPEARKARSRRNVALALALTAFIVLVFIVTVARLAGNTGAH